MPNAFSPILWWLLYIGLALMIFPSCVRALQRRRGGRGGPTGDRPRLADTPMPFWERATTLAGHASLDVTLVGAAVGVYRQIASGARAGDWTDWTLYVWAAATTSTLAIAMPLRLWQTAKGRRELFPWRRPRS